MTALRCKKCGDFYKVGSDGRLVAHLRKRTGRLCGREPAPSRPEEYPTGFDTEPQWVMRGGLPTLGKGHR